MFTNDKYESFVTNEHEPFIFTICKHCLGLVSYLLVIYYQNHCATSRKVAGSIPDGVSGIFYWHNPSGRTTALGSTQPLTEISTRNISWGVKAAGALGWQPYHLHVPIVLKSGSLNFLEPSGLVQAYNGIVLPFIIRMWGLMVLVCWLFYLIEMVMLLCW
jgi:hypothetical protein